LAQEKFDVDLVLCLGYMYHTYRHTELMYWLHELAPEHLIVDTRVTLDPQPTLALVREPSVEHIRGAAQDPFSVGQVLALRPSVPAVQMLLQAHGFQIESSYDWRSRLAGRQVMPGLEGYANDNRVTLRCRWRDAADGAGWELASRSSTAAPRPRKRADTASAQAAGGWRGRVNRTLAKATGYELRRASTRR
jgi:hypothetical protein